MILSISTVYSTAMRATLGQSSYPGGMMGGYGYGVGPTGGSSAYWGGMMGGYGGMMGGYSGMMAGNGGMMSMYSPHHWNGTANGALIVLFRNGFYPATLTIAKGSTVTWVNMDFVQHTVTSGSEQAPTDLFDSHEFNHMQSFSYMFNTPGTYSYFCDIHPDMVGKVTVTG